MSLRAFAAAFFATALGISACGGSDPLPPEVPIDPLEDPEPEFEEAEPTPPPPPSEGEGAADTFGRCDLDAVTVQLAVPAGYSFIGPPRGCGVQSGDIMLIVQAIDPADSETLAAEDGARQWLLRSGRMGSAPTEIALAEISIAGNAERIYRFRGSLRGIDRPREVSVLRTQVATVFLVVVAIHAPEREDQLNEVMQLVSRIAIHSE